MSTLFGSTVKLLLLLSNDSYIKLFIFISWSGFLFKFMFSLLLFDDGELFLLSFFSFDVVGEFFKFSFIYLFLSLLLLLFKLLLLLLSFSVICNIFLIKWLKASLNFGFIKTFIILVNICLKALSSSPSTIWQ